MAKESNSFEIGLKMEKVWPVPIIGPMLLKQLKTALTTVMKLLLSRLTTKSRPIVIKLYIVCLLYTSGMGRALMGVLIGVIIASVVNMFLRSSGMDYILSIISVFLFAGLTAWDNQKIRYVYDQTNGQPATGWAVAMALELYLDFINLFISLLRIFGRND